MDLMQFSDKGFPFINPTVFRTTRMGTPYLKTAGVAMIKGPDVDLSGVQGFLDGFDLDLGFREYLGDPHLLPPAERLIKFAGQTCYLSLGPDRTWNKDCDRYLANIKSSGHGSVTEHADFTFFIWGIDRTVTHELVRHRAGFGFCLSGDTEVYSGSKQNSRFDGVKRKWTMRQLYEMSLTPHGRSRLKLIKVRCLNGDQFVPAKIKTVVASGEKDIFKVTLRDGKTIRCSADHRFLTPDGWKPVRELAPGVAMASNGVAALDIDAEWLRRRYHDENAMLADMAAEIGCSPHTIRSYLRRYGLQKEQGQGQRGRTPPNKGKRYKLGPFHSEEAKERFRQAKLGELNPQWKGDEASAQAGRLRANRLYSTEPCEECGDPRGQRHHKDRNTLNNERSNIEFLCASCHTKRHAAEDGPHNVLRPRWITIESIEADGREMTYDLEVDHPAHNFVANGIVTHNSQVSQRYVDGSKLRFVERPEYQIESIGPEPEIGDQEKWKPWNALSDCVLGLHAEFEWEIDAAQAEYESKAQKLILARNLGHPMLQGGSKTEQRKQVNQCARERLPGCTEAPIVATANARAWRHMIEMRANSAAEVAIRSMAMKIYACITHVAPILFSDYVVRELPTSGTTAVETTTRKI